MVCCLDNTPRLDGTRSDRDGGQGRHDHRIRQQPSLNCRKRRRHALARASRRAPSFLILEATRAIELVGQSEILTRLRAFQPRPRLLGFPVAPSLRAECGGDRITRAFAATAVRSMTWRGGETEIHYLTSASWRIMFSHFLIAPGRRYLWSEATRKWNSPTDRAKLKLPGPLGFIYYLLPAPLWLGRFGRRLFGRPA